MVLSCPPQLSWKEKGKVGTLRGYIYLHNGGDGDDAWTMVHLQKNILPTFFLSFFKKNNNNALSTRLVSKLQ